MTRLIDHYRNTDIRKAELDPSTFANDDELIAWAEKLQTQPERTGLNWWGVFGLAIMGLSAFITLSLIYSAIKFLGDN